MENHLLSREIKFGSRPSYAYWSMVPSDCIVVFVHGFRGDALGTWHDFGATFGQHFPDIDVIFFGYESARQRSDMSASRLQSLLDVIAGAPSNKRRKDLGLPLDRARSRFTKIVIAAHSLGALVARQALLRAHGAGATWCPLTRLVCFAPAHSGANILHLLDEVLLGVQVPGVGVVGPLLKGIWPSLNDIDESKRDPTFSRVEVAVTQAIAAGATYLRATEVWMGGKDRVVTTPVMYATDPATQYVDGQGHVSLCKPRRDYTLPVDVLRKVI